MRRLEARRSITLPDVRMGIETLRFFDPMADTEVTANHLPHWDQDGRTYFVTFRAADSLPAGIRAEFENALDAWLKWHPKPWDEKTEHEYWEHFGQKTEKWLDESHGACLLRQPRLAEIVGNALQFHEGKLSRQHAWVVMPNHVHALFSTIGDGTLSKLLHSWKSFTSNEINKAVGASGSFWQKDYFDRLIRSTEHFWRCARYIRKNPYHLRPGGFRLWESDWLAKGLNA